MEHLADEGLKSFSRRGLGLTDHVGPAPAADARRAGFDRQPYARRPPSSLGLRPSRSSPTRGEGNGAPALCESASPFGRGVRARLSRGAHPSRPRPGNASSSQYDAVWTQPLRKPMPVSTSRAPIAFST